MNGDIYWGVCTMMTNEEMFKQSGSLLDGHFRLTSGRHSNQYFQCALLLQYPEFSEAFCGQLVQYFQKEMINTVIAPAVGGIVVAQETGRLLGVRSLFSERKDGIMTLRRGFSITAGERVLVVEDVVTTGGSVREVIELVRTAGAEVAGVGAIVDRSGGRVNFGVPFFAAHVQQVVTWSEEECPLCQKGVPVDAPGSRHLQR